MAEMGETNFDESKETIAYLWWIGLKLKAYTSCVPYLEVFNPISAAGRCDRPLSTLL